ncbi:hypothetical protein EBZ37_00015 [bacterium]|nr:hypothetical protein [bacterium]
MRTDWTLLETLLSTPTAPFREDQVRAVVEDTLIDAGVPFFEDHYGNVVVGAKSPADYRKALSKKSKEPVRVFIAHMDHPGFHGLEWLSPTELRVQWHGGSPVQHLDGAKVWVSVDGFHGYADSGALKEVKIAEHGRAIAQAIVQFNESSVYSHFAAKPEAIFGGFQFRSPCFQENDCYYTKAADDLVGCFAILSMARELYGKNRKSSSAPRVFGLLTRAEEVGFIGAIEHFEKGWYTKAKSPVIAVSLETSRTLPGADIGKGPVVRLGDRKTVFHPDYLQVLSSIAAPNTFQTPLIKPVISVELWMEDPARRRLQRLMEYPRSEFLSLWEITTIRDSRVAQTVREKMGQLPNLCIGLMSRDYSLWCAELPHQSSTGLTPGRPCDKAFESRFEPIVVTDEVI